MPDNTPKSDAQRIAEIRDLLPTTLGSAEVRAQLAAELRANSVFVCRAANVVFLSKVKEVVDAISGGRMDAASGRVALLETLRAIGYTPEGGFKDVPAGQVPPAVAGTLQDLTSFRRLSLIVDTQISLTNGRGQQLRGMETERFKLFPAWELVRVESRAAPRNWGATQEGSPPIHQGKPDLRSRWTIAGGNFWAGRMIAFKGDPVWGELGASANFDDALDVDHPPFAFNSGMGWEEIPRSEVAALGVTGPDGETLAEWLAMDHPVLASLPAPVISTREAAPELVAAMEQTTPAVVVGTKITTPDNAARIAEIEKHSADRLQAAIDRRNKEYADRERKALGEP